MTPLYVGLLLCAALVSRRDNRTANRLLAVAIAGTLYDHSGAQLILWGEVAEDPYLYRSAFPVALLAIPFFFLFVKAMTIPTFRWDLKTTWHLAPFAFGLLWYFGFLFFSGPEYFTVGEAFLRERYWRLLIKGALQIGYLSAIVQLLLNYERRIRNHTSVLKPVQDLWIKVLVAGAVLLVAVDFVDIATGPLNPIWHIHFNVVSGVTLFLGFFSLYHSSAFAKETAVQSQEMAGPVDRLTEEQLARHRAKLTLYLEEQRPFLKQDLRLSDVAKALDVKPYVLTEVIRRGFETNFYDLINRSRVEWAAKLMRNPNCSHMNLLGIAMDSGFNSKSVFNSAFKRFMKVTPSEYRKES